jgi:hypothetical protein
MLTGEHPFYKKGDTEESFINRISKEDIEKWLGLFFLDYNISSQA